MVASTFPFTMWLLYVLLAAQKLIVHLQSLAQSAMQTQNKKMGPTLLYQEIHNLIHLLFFPQGKC